MTAAAIWVGAMCPSSSGSRLASIKHVVVYHWQQYAEVLIAGRDGVGCHAELGRQCSQYRVA
ncbi:hypothetical protein PF005_g347 [Phytophthora fragariae]|uniref:Uncharacterized protein n=2 Tax=Phytophthora TaxID=4783 RepID=A0A6A3FDK7_9STRA|nr:hypothetical protein PF003_g12495 [Phytophthora fragariae]KAE9360402.1 hypothetical protein PR003_g241 [Phytophthora rubi]KAE8943213.1 hypothetical protein PF009_g7066 [Phytophthora fragariae]KAE9019674.1 hypothetical protein PF011_g5728 [Phytophthora fragariae]KAE9126074.1 hypothetical protein PF007_g6115 [Phytophthora fragariae]